MPQSLTSSPGLVLCLQYMDRTYVTQQHKTPVYQLGLDLWRDNVMRHPTIRDRLRTILLEMVQRERTGDLINHGIFKQITKVNGRVLPGRVDVHMSSLGGG